MKTRRFKREGYKNKLLLCLCIVAILILQGCTYADTLLNKFTHGDMAGVTTNCNVFSVDGTLGSHNFICENSTNTYVYHNNAICDYDSMEELVQVEDLEFMACNNDVLYYATANQGGELYSYSFSENKNTFVTDEYRITGMKAHDNDVFVSGRINDGNNGRKEDYQYDLIYYHGSEEGINVSEWAATHTEVNTTEDYGIFEFEGYDIAADHWLGEENPQLVFVEHADGFQYSCYGYNTYAEIQEKYLRLSFDVTCRYLGIEEEIPEIVETDYDYAEAGLSASQIGFYNNHAYMIAQYGKGTPGYQENPTKDFKVLDAFYEFFPETGECKMLYKVQEGEQIAGFCYEKNCLYLLRNDGVYRYDWETENEECIFENLNYECLSFEYFHDKLFIFSSPYSVHSQVELLSVVE